MAALFATFEIPQLSPRENSKSGKGREKDEPIARKKELRDMEDARRASLADEEACQMRAKELVIGASSSRTVEIVRGTADSVFDAEDITEGVQITEVVGSGETDPLAC